MNDKALSQEPTDDATLKDIFCMGCEYKEQEPCRVKNELNVELNELKPCTDAVSREAVLNTEYQVKIINDIEYVMLSEVQMKIRKMPHVTQKSGKWIDINGIYAECSNCNEEIYITGDFKYCPNCGARMESEE